MLNTLESLPIEFLNRPATRLHEIISGPTLFHLKGKKNPPLFVSVLLHGNEDTGYEAVKCLLKKYEGKELPRSLSLFVGNVNAAKEGLRRLDNQPDFNRIWLPGPSPEHQMTQAILDIMKGRGVFASVDVHNNTGINPHYACVNRLDHRFFRLATLFSRVVVYFIRPEGVQTSAFADLCPAVTLECGKVGEKSGIQHAADYLEACLHLNEISDHPVPHGDLDLFHTVAILKIPEHRSLTFEGKGAEICLRHDLDHLNFQELEVNTVWGSIAPNSAARLVVMNESGIDVDEQFFTYEGGEIRNRRRLMPSMLTLNQAVIRQDCLGYLMERMEIPNPPL